MIEPEEIRTILSEEMGAPFRVAKPLPHDPATGENPKWFVICPDVKFAKQTGYARAAWADEADKVWIGSDIIGDSIEWIETFYGEESQEPNLDYSTLSDDAFEKELGKDFPRLLDHIKNIKSIARDVSESRKVHLEIKRSGSNDVQVFTLAASIDPIDLRARPLRELVVSNLNALKEAHGEIIKALIR
jgi:hypothetical protein